MHFSGCIADIHFFVCIALDVHFMVASLWICTLLVHRFGYALYECIALDMHFMGCIGLDMHFGYECVDNVGA